MAWMLRIVTWDLLSSIGIVRMEIGYLRGRLVEGMREGRGVCCFVISWVDFTLWLIFRLVLLAETGMCACSMSLTRDKILWMVLWSVHLREESTCAICYRWLAIKLAL